jgi:hypothetical protein
MSRRKAMTQAEKRQILDVLIYALSHAKCAYEIAMKDDPDPNSYLVVSNKKDYEAVKTAYDTMCKEVGIEDA